MSNMQILFAVVSNVGLLLYAFAGVRLFANWLGLGLPFTFFVSLDACLLFYFTSVF